MSSKRLRRAAVIGSPVSHSLSPAMFQYIVDHEEIPLEYQAKELKEAELESFLKQLRKDPFQVGVNVTIPFKEKVGEFLDEVSPDAKALGAVNVIFNDNERLKGYNTDVIGIEKTLDHAELSLSKKSALMLGAGGAAKAVAFVLGKMNLSTVYIYNPRSTRGEELAKQFQTLCPDTRFQTVASLDEVKEKLSLVVNTTPIGMKESDDVSLFDGLKALSFEPSALAFDLIYTPLLTPFLKQSRELGLKIENGLRMLVEQALATYEIWIGSLKDAKFKKEDLLSYLRGVLAIRQNQGPVFLAGFMGAGKTTVGRSLSKITARTFVDTDQEIESSARQSVADIFASYGEPEFRRLETLAIERFTRSEGCIVSLGGGALMKEENLKMILETGTLVYLRADEALLLDRLNRSKQNRPLMANLSDEERREKIGSMLKVRGPVYERAHLIVEVEESEHRVAQAILIGMGERACA